ncbi:MAG: hypothetical protein CVV56_00625 [Tenericutes bacterium HGW-Tenericutes-1]|jgi:hypothetical protein|nr:MAG: hypothetical protein CVV56_00625 [Tenericutes bacterium HGW-Tenericutes-1]
MPESLSYVMIFNLLFYGILGLAVLGGFLRGFKKTLFNFILMAVFYLVFFLTIESVSTALWSMTIPQLGTGLGFIDSSLSSYTSFEEAFNPLMVALLNIDLSTADAAMSEFILGMGMFVVKIAYTIIYFTVGLVLWKIVGFILRLIFIHNKKGENKNRLFGAIFGFANGALAVAVLLIMMGGFMSVVESISNVLPEDFDPTNLSLEPDRHQLYEASYSVIDLAETGDYTPADLVEIVDAYNGNLIVSIANSITMEDSYGQETPFNLVLFDKVVSFTYNDEQVSIRQELKVVSVIMASVFEALDEAGVAVTDLSGEDMGVILSAAASVDLTMLLDSKLISNALVYILSGDAGIEISDMLVIPDDIVWFDVLDDEGEIVTNGELRNILLALNAIVDVAGMIDFTNLDLNVISALTDDTIDTIFNSNVLVATVSNLLLTQDFGDTEVVIPDSVFDENGYLYKTELKAMANAVRLVVSETLTGSEFDFTAALTLSPTQIDTLFESEILSATIGKYLYSMSADPLIIPATVVEEVETSNGTILHTVVTTVEMKAVFNALAIIGFEDFDTMAFDATLIENFESTETPGTLDDDKLDTLFESGILHATFSKMLLDLTSGVDAVVSIPYFDSENNEVRETVGTIEYISTDELKATLKAIYALGFDDFDSLGTLDPSLLFDNIDVILESATLHATISETLFDLGSGVLEIPTLDFDNVSTVVTVGSGSTLTTYLIKDEITGIIDGLNVLGINDIEGFGGSISLANIVTETDQDKLLSSASLHYTVSKTLLDLGDSVLIVPEYTEDGIAEINRITKTVGTYDYVSKTELKALINAFKTMGFTNLESFGAEIESEAFFTNAAELIESASIQATLSDKMLNGTGGNLVVPDSVRTTVGLVTYVDSTEILALMDSLDLIGLNDFTALSFNPSNLFGVDYDVLFASSSMQATVSKPVLDAALDETAAVGTTSLIVPNALRESINVNTLPVDQIELDELKTLLEALDVLGITDFTTGNFDATTITSLTDPQLTTMLLSGSIHVTFDNMLDSNPNISVPELAETDLLYSVNNLTLANEIKYFILAAGTIGGSDFTSVDFDYTAIMALSDTEQQTILISMIVRNILTPDLETAVTVMNITADPDYVVDAEDYENNDILTFFTYLDIIEILKFLNDEPYID